MIRKVAIIKSDIGSLNDTLFKAGLPSETSKFKKQVGFLFDNRIAGPCCFSLPSSRRGPAFCFWRLDMFKFTKVSKKVKIEHLNNNDIGRWVKYTAHHGEIEKGRIKSWNSHYVFVVFHCADEWDNFQDYTAAACCPKQLKFIECPEERK
jgi:hypothetical protein